MTNRAHGWIVLVVLIAAVLGSAYTIVERNSPALNSSTAVTSSGTFH
jgi:hypothetical protein